MKRSPLWRVILVTDPAFGDDQIVRCIQLAAGALPRGWLCVQLRDKGRTRVSMRVFASRLRVVTRAMDTALLINGDPHLARDVGAEGVHLGRGSASVAEARSVCGARAWISVAVHSDDAVRNAADSGADAVLVSPVFSTRGPSLLLPSGQGSPRKEGRGVDALRSARTIALGRVALYALGGVTAENAGACMAAGADGIAVMRVLLASVRPGGIARALHDAIDVHC